MEVGQGSDATRLARQVERGKHRGLAGDLVGYAHGADPIVQPAEFRSDAESMPRLAV